MVTWLKTMGVGLGLAAGGAFLVSIGKATPTIDFSSIGWLIGGVGIVIIILGGLTKIKYGLKGN